VSQSQTCHVHKASPTLRDEPVESVTIHIDQTASDRWSVEEARATWQGDATRLADALLDALPGGTIDQLMAELMLRRAVLYRVRFPPTDGGPG
jgi:hypothetical protein